MNNQIVTGFDGNKYWPFKILKRTDKTATVIQCNYDGSKEYGEARTKKIEYHSGTPSVQYHRQEIVYLDRPYVEE